MLLADESRPWGLNCMPGDLHVQGSTNVGVVKQSKGTLKPCLPLRINEELCFRRELQFPNSAFLEAGLSNCNTAKRTRRFLVSGIRKELGLRFARSAT